MIQDQSQLSPSTETLARMIRAGMYAARGDHAVASAELDAAETAFLVVDMHLYAAVARRLRGVLKGGAEGDALVASADAWMTAQGIRNPARMAAMYGPGFGRLEAGR